jgi:hypothetical protein
VVVVRVVPVLVVVLVGENCVRVRSCVASKGLYVWQWVVCWELGRHWVGLSLLALLLLEQGSPLLLVHLVRGALPSQEVEGRTSLSVVELAVFSGRWSSVHGESVAMSQVF